MTATALVDELAAAADLAKGKLAGRPLAVIRGLGHLVEDTQSGPGPWSDRLRATCSPTAAARRLAAALASAGRLDAYERIVALDGPDRVREVLAVVGARGRPPCSGRCWRPISLPRPSSVSRDRLGAAVRPTLEQGVPLVAVKTTGSSRRGRLASFEAARKKEQRNRTIRLLVICVVLAVALLAYPVYLFVDDYRARNADLATIGADLTAAACDAPTETPASGNQDHVADGTKVTYTEFPPASGQHYATPAPFTKHFYTMADRPPVETLVHNLEHGYTVLWYREGAPDDVVDDAERAAKTFGGDDYDPADKFIAAPWSEADGGPFPEGKNVILTRWTASSGPERHDAAVRRPPGCRLSGQAIKDFMAKYPVASSPSRTERSRARGRPEYSTTRTSDRGGQSPRRPALIRSASLTGQTRVICGVCTITVSLSPTTATSRPSRRC